MYHTNIVGIVDRKHCTGLGTLPASLPVKTIKPAVVVFSRINYKHLTVHNFNFLTITLKISMHVLVTV